MMLYEWFCVAAVVGGWVICKIAFPPAQRDGNQICGKEEQWQLEHLSGMRTR